MKADRTMSFKLNIIFLFLEMMFSTAQECSDYGELGMSSGEIRDWQITASSSYPTEWDAMCNTKYARLYLENGLAWCSRVKSSSEWIQVNLGVQSTVAAILTQGRGDGREWVTSYLVSYSSDGEVWNYITEDNDIPRTFKGNTDSYNIEHAYLPTPVLARFIKIQIQTWNNHPSMRLEFIGCRDNKQRLGLPPYGLLYASTTHSYKKGSSCVPADGYIHSSKGWCAAVSDEHQWIQLDIGPPSLVTAIATRGRGDTGRKQWVTRYKLSYSNNSDEWTFYKETLKPTENLIESVTSDDPSMEEQNLINSEGVMEFGGNYDKESERIHYLTNPFTARYIRFHPVAWNNNVAMRVGVLGRQYKGECLAGFTRPNTISPCVENIAFKKETWLNKDRHSKRALAGNRVDQKLAEKAVDGNTDNNINACTILDNYYDAEPQLTIDLGSRQDVSGVVIYMWKGDDNQKAESYKDYAINLESIAVYVSSGKTGETLCGRISNRENQIMSKREQKVLCNKKIDGRYIRIQPEGRPSWYTNWYSAVICEVMAFT